MNAVVLPVFFLTATMVGCSMFGGDLIIRISGSVPQSRLEEQAADQCSLDMISVETGKRVSYRDVPKDFSTTMMVVAGPKPKSYYFVAQCGEGREYRSREVVVSSRSSFSRNFELGMLTEGQ